MLQTVLLFCQISHSTAHTRTHTQICRDETQCSAHLAVIRSKSKKKNCGTQKPCRTNASPPAGAFSKHRGPNSSVSRKLLHYTALIYCILPKGLTDACPFTLKSTSTSQSLQTTLIRQPIQISFFLFILLVNALNEY